MVFEDCSALLVMISFPIYFIQNFKENKKKLKYLCQEQM